MSEKSIISIHDALRNLAVEAKINLEKQNIKHVSPVICLLRKKKLEEIELTASELGLDKDMLIKEIINNTFEESYSEILQRTLFNISIKDSKIPLEKLKDNLSDKEIDFLRKYREEKKEGEEKIKGCGRSIGMRNNTKFCGDTHSWDNVQLCDECKKRIKLEGEKKKKKNN